MGTNILNSSHSVTEQSPPGHFNDLVNLSLNVDQTIPKFWSNRPVWLYLRIFKFKKMVENLSFDLLHPFQVIIIPLSHQGGVLKGILLRP